MTNTINKKGKFHSMVETYIANFHQHGIKRFMVDYCGRPKSKGFSNEDGG